MCVFARARAPLYVFYQRGAGSAELLATVLSESIRRGLVAR